MKRQLDILIALSVGLVVAIAYNLAIAREEPIPHGTLEFFVFRRLVKQIEPVSHVTILLVRGGNVQALVSTNNHGYVAVDKSLLTDATALLFCETDKSWSCNALRLDVDRNAILGFDELSVELSGGLNILDRRRIPAPTKVRKGSEVEGESDKRH